MRRTALALLLPLTAAAEDKPMPGTTKAAFGTLMALEPAIALLIGAVVLHQVPVAAQIVGIGCVVLAGIAAERSGHRDDELPDLGSPPG